MGSRYGRKQKRAHRAAMAELQQNRLSLSTQLDYRMGQLRECERAQHNMRERLRDWDERIRMLLGPYTSAAINDTTFRVDRGHIRQMAVMPSIDMPSVLRGPEVMPMELVAYVEEIVYLIGTMTKEDRLELSRRMYFDVDNFVLRREACSGMSRRYFEDLMRAGDRGIEILSKTIAKQAAAILLQEQKAQRNHEQAHPVR